LAVAGLIAFVVAISAGGLLNATAARLNQHRRRYLITDNEEDIAPDSEPYEEEQQSLIAMQIKPDPYADRDKLEMVLSGEAKLTQLRFMPDSFPDNKDSSYTGVYGIFCVYDDKLNKKEPAVYPTADHMMHTSDHCQEHRYTLPLNTVITAVTSHDNHTPTQKKLPLSGMLFHQGYSGAGLIANALSTFDNTVVVSEHTAIRDALSACDYIHNRFSTTNTCSSAKHKKLVMDVISLLSRSNVDDNMDHLYLKLDSASSVYIPMLRSMFPHAKWTFSYRTAEHVLAKSTEPKRNTCKNTRRQPSKAMSANALEHSIDLEELTTHEVCALHLSTLLDVAYQEHKSSGTGMLLSYDDDLLQGEDVLLDLVLPYLGLQTEIDSDPIMVKSRVDKVLSLKSNVRGIHSQDESKEWEYGNGGVVEDVPVSEEVRAASQLYMTSMTSL
jgi:hypothetical protein